MHRPRVASTCSFFLVEASEQGNEQAAVLIGTRISHLKKKNHNNMKRGICILDLIHEDMDPLKREGIVMNPV